MKTYSQFRNKLLEDKEIGKAYSDFEAEFAIVQAIIEKRLEKGFTQSDLAKKVGTKQSAISRLESGNYNPTINFLDKVAKALNLKLIVSLSNKASAC